MTTSSVKGSKNAVVLDSVLQEIDIPTGLVLYRWDSLDHVALTDTYTPLAAKGHPFDYVHINSIQQDTDGNLIVPARNTSTAYKIDRRTGAVIWHLGGKHSTFRMGKGTGFAFQHDVRARSGGIVTLFDDGAGPPRVHNESRAITLQLDAIHGTATLAGQDLHGPALLANPGIAPIGCPGARARRHSPRSRRPPRGGPLPSSPAGTAPRGWPHGGCSRAHGRTR